MTNKKQVESPMVEFAKKDKQAMGWLISRIGAYPDIYEAKTPQKLSALAKKDDQIYAVVVPAETGENWWGKYFGNVNPYVYFLNGVEETTGKPLALAIMNYPYPSVDMLDTRSIIENLVSLGFTKTKIAEHLGVNKMAVQRLGIVASNNQNKEFSKMLQVRLDLYSFHQHVMKTMQEDAVKELEKKEKK